MKGFRFKLQAYQLVTERAHQENSERLQATATQVFEEENSLVRLKAGLARTESTSRLQGGENISPNERIATVARIQQQVQLLRDTRLRLDMLTRKLNEDQRRYLESKALLEKLKEIKDRAISSHRTALEKNLAREEEHLIQIGGRPLHED